MTIILNILNGLLIAFHLKAETLNVNYPMMIISEQANKINDIAILELKKPLSFQIW